MYFDQLQKFTQVKEGIGIQSEVFQQAVTKLSYIQFLHLPLLNFSLLNSRDRNIIIDFSIYCTCFSYKLEKVEIMQIGPLKMVLSDTSYSPCLKKKFN